MVYHRITSILQGQGLNPTLLRGGLGSIGLKIVGTGLSLLMAVVLARSLGPEGYGIYSYVLAIVTLLALPAQAGLPTLVVRETSKAEARNHWEIMRGLWRWSSAVALFLSFILVLFAFTAATLAPNYFESGYLDTFYWALMLVPLIALGNIRGAALRGLRKVVQGQLPETIIRPGLFVLIFFLFSMTFPQKLTPSIAMATHGLAAGFAFLIGAWLLYRARPMPLRNSQGVEYQTSAWVRTLIPLAVISGISVINAQADILMLGWFRSAEEVGIYRVAASAVGLIGFGMAALTSMLAPHFARLYSEEDACGLQRTVTLGTRAMMALALPVFLVFTLAGAPLLTFAFGEEFSSAYLPLVILSIGNLISVAVGAVGALLNMSGHERYTARGTLIAATVNLLLNSLLIPFWGVVGAALATSGSLALWNLLLWRTAKARVGISSGIIGRLT